MAQLSLQGGDPIDDIVAQIEAILTGLTPPTAAPKAPAVSSDLAPDGTVLPVWHIVPRRGTRLHSSTGVRSFDWTIDLILLFSRGETRYASQAERLWVPVVLNAFDAEIKLNGTVQVAFITDIDFDPVEVNDIPYVAVTFTLTATVSEAFTFAAGV